jgi:hypothetical protein
MLLSTGIVTETPNSSRFGSRRVAMYLASLSESQLRHSLTLGLWPLMKRVFES